MPNANQLDGIGSAGFWQLGGNAGTSSSDFLGTTDNNPLTIKVNGKRVLRLEPTFDGPNVIGGDASNTIDSGVIAGTIAGGGQESSGNEVTDYLGTVAGGSANQAGDGAGAVNDAVWASVGGGSSNTASGKAATVAGGLSNTADGTESTVAGGSSNTADGASSSVAGGYSNAATGSESGVAGGYSNTADGSFSTVAGGDLNSAAGDRAAVLGGTNNSAGGSIATVAGGGANTADGDFSFAAGRHAHADSNGAFVWADSSTTADVTAPAPNTFNIRAAGGIWLGTNSSPSIASGRFIDTSTGAYLSSAGAWTDNSDRNLKHAFRRLNDQLILRKVAKLPITSWSYKAEPTSVRHIGPMAQDFSKTFGLGLDNKHIATLDESGVALTAVKGLTARVRSQHRRLRSQGRRIAALEREVKRLAAGR